MKPSRKGIGTLSMFIQWTAGEVTDVRLPASLEGPSLLAQLDCGVYDLWSTTADELTTRWPTTKNYIHNLTYTANIIRSTA